MHILGIETSCDETSLALIEVLSPARERTPPQFKVIKNLISSQTKIHEPFGGVVPNLAKREHLKNLPILYKKFITPHPSLLTIDLIAVTVGPGLEPALWTGIEFAKKIHADLRRQYVDQHKLIQAYPHKSASHLRSSAPPLVGVNHLEGHLYSFLLTPKPYTLLNPQMIFPAISLIVSGGHTILLLMKNLYEWKKLGETRDDAAGEAFDKVARLLELPYPGGPQIEKISKKGNPAAIEFPRPMLHQKNYDFSFSGLKTAVLYHLRNTSPNPKPRTQNPANVAASFQAAILDVLVGKTMRAAKEFNAKSIILSGGVAANKPLRRALAKETKKSCLAFFAPEFGYNTDNAAMIAVAGYINSTRKKRFKLEANGNLEI